MNIEHMRVNHIKNPMGFLMDKPVFSYKVKGAKGKKQASGRIQVSKQKDMSNPIYDSGERSDMDSIAFEANLVLEAKTRYYWNVNVITDAGEEGKSETAWFETGKREEPWEAQWITSELNNIHPVFYKSFEIESDVINARLYICGLGLYEAYLNGKKISDEYLTPYCNDYTQWLQYQTYDVTDLAKSRELNVEVLLGNGWYKGRFGLDDDGSTRELYGDRFLLIAELHLYYSDGSHEVIGTDDTWQAKKSSILDSSFYDGEIYDATFKEAMVYPVQLWNQPMAPLRERLSLPIKVMETIEPVRVLRTPKDELVLDLGQNHSGWFQLKVREDKGTKIKLYFGEELQDECFYNGNLRTGKQEFSYIADGEERVIRPHFTSYGYRYVKLEGVSKFQEGDYLGLVLYSELEETGHIETGNELVNRLALNSMWGQKSNFLDIPMDCPQRDERMGWTGDAQVFTKTACYNMNSYAFYRKYLYDMYEEQKHRGGAVPFVVPACGQDSSCGVWGDAATIIPFAVYEYYGDKHILQEQYHSMKDWVDYIQKVNGDDWAWRKVFHFGDWLALDSRNEAMPTGGTDTGYVATVYYYQSIQLTAQAARILGKENDAKKYGQLAQDIKKEIQEEYFTAKGRLSIDTQTGYLTALRFDLSPNPERTKKELRQSFKRNYDKLETGFVGTSMLCNVLSENGMNELAYSLLLSEEYPGWLFSVKRGATTIWERWDSLDENGHFSPSGLNSLNHYSYGAIVEWMFRHSAGISPRVEKPGFREIDLIPKPDYRLGKMDARFDSPIGIYRSKWEVTENFGLQLDIEVPFGGTAYLRLPYASDEIYEESDNEIFAEVVEIDGVVCCKLTAGNYSITYETTKPMKKETDESATIAELMGNERTKAIMLQVIPMITQLPESMYGMTLEEIFARVGDAITEGQMERIYKMLNVEQLG